MRIVYLILIAAAALFAIQYRPSLSVALLVSLVLFPIVLGAVYFYASRKMRAELKVSTTSTGAGQDIPMTITISNPTIIPVGCAQVMLEIGVSSSAKPERVCINTPVFPMNDQVLTTSFSSEHFGVVSISLKRVTVCDILKLTRFRLRRKSVVCEAEPIVVLPVPSALTSAVADYSDAGLESEIYSDTKAGDDPSEIFAIRDYMDGDRMSRIHWKLTAKEDKLMVKDYSLPMSDSCLIIADTYTDPADPAAPELYDTVIETTVSLSMLLCDNNTRHRIACYHKPTGELAEYEVADHDDYITASTKLLDCGICERSGLAAEEEIMRESTGLRFGHLLLICSAPDENIFAALKESGIAVRYTLLVCTPPDRTPELSPETAAEAVQVVCGDIGASLAELTV